MTERFPTVAEALGGKHILLTGATGFLGKLILSMLFDRDPGFRKVSLPIRPPSAGGTASDRFLREVAASDALKPIRRKFGSNYRRVLAERVNILAGDVSKEHIGLEKSEAEELGADIDVVIHCAGLVDFLPPLDRSLRINVDGTLNTLDLVLPHGKAAFVHVSTCYVSGLRDGQIDEELRHEDFPSRGEAGFEGFDSELELAQARELIKRLHDDADDPAALAEVWDLAKGSRHRARRFVQEKIKLTSRKLGVDRAARWGWPNTYTYGKAMAERLVKKRVKEAGDKIRATIVRPAVIESSVAYPHPGWNQGGNTSAPLVFLASMGQRLWPVSDGHILDVIPVDDAAAATIAVAARAAVADVPEVFQIGSSHVNPFHSRRVVELASLRYRAMKDPSIGTGLKLRRKYLEPVAVPRADYDRWSVPTMAKIVSGIGKAAKWVAKAPMLPPKLEPLARGASKKVNESEKMLRRLEMLIEQYKPFLAGPCQVFRTDNVQRLYDTMTPEDREAYPYRPEKIDWRHYWMQIHIPGLERHAFPELRARLRAEAAFLEVGGAEEPRVPDTLLEILDESADRYGDRAALKWIEADGHEGRVPQEASPSEDSVSFDQWRRRAVVIGRKLTKLGVARADRVALVSENRPAWGAAFFGILAAEATAVPLESQLSARDVLSLVRAAGCRAIVISRARLEEIGEELRAGLPTVSSNGKPVLSEVEGPPVVVELETLMEETIAEVEKLEPSSRLLEGSLSEEPPPASIIFTSGTTGDPKGVVLTHENFAWQVVTLAGLFPLSSDDRILGVLPLHHAFEFTCGFLLPLYRGAPVTYLREQTVEAVRHGLKMRPTAMIGVPALWEAFWRQVVRELKSRGQRVETAVRVALEAHRAVRSKAGLNFGPTLFSEVHRGFGGKLRFVVSGGAAIGREVLEGLQALGIDIYEGYGLTEASPVVATTKPGDPVGAGSVGHPLPGVECEIADPDGEGVGEIIVRGPGVMKGYWNNPEATDATIGDGWLHTGDLGRLDEEGRLHVVGRLKEVIVDPAGNTIYPEEVEEAYAASTDIVEIGVAGVEVAPQKEVIGALVVPRGDGEGGLPAARERIVEHFARIDKTLPRPKRVQVLRFTTKDLPRTATRKVKRNLVSRQLAEMLRPELDPRRSGAVKADGSEVAVPDKIRRVVAQTAGVDPTSVSARSHLVEDIGFDSLMVAELIVALEAELRCQLPSNVTSEAKTVGDLVRICGEHSEHSGAATAVEKGERGPAPMLLPKPVRTLGRAVVDAGRHLAYDRIFNVTVKGRTHVPRHTHMIVSANHSSHLDIGLVKAAIGDLGESMLSLAARDYFFGGTWSRAWFENFTDVIPFDRDGGVRDSLENSVQLVRSGRSVVIFPEGTRSPTGRMSRFRPGLGYLVLHSRTGVLPVYLHGAHRALPEGASLPRHRDLEGRIGPFMPFERLSAAVEGLPRREQYRVISDICFEAVAALRDSRRFDLDEVRDRALKSPEELGRAASGRSAQVGS